MTAGKAGGLALLCSFAVYFIPIVGPHASFFIFETIRQQFRAFTHPAWAFSGLGAAVGLQTVAFATFYWFWRRRSALSVAGLPAYGFAAVVLAQLIYMLWLPSYFLIEADTAPETGAWTEACTVKDASMMTAATSCSPPAIWTFPLASSRSRREGSRWCSARTFRRTRARGTC
jgi:hypothetical protein